MKILDERRHAAISEQRWGSHPWPPDIDLFASEAAHQCPLYYAAMWDRSCIGMDAFQHHWGEWPDAVQRITWRSKEGAAGGAGARPTAVRESVRTAALRKGGEGSKPDAVRARSRRSGVVMHAVAGVSGEARMAEIRAPPPSRQQPVCFAFPPPGDVRKVLRKILRDRATVWLVHCRDLAVTDRMLLQSLPVLFSRALGRDVDGLVTPTKRNRIAIESGLRWTQDLQICLISWE